MKHTEPPPAHPPTPTKESTHTHTHTHTPNSSEDNGRVGEEEDACVWGGGRAGDSRRSCREKRGKEMGREEEGGGDDECGEGAMPVFFERGKKWGQKPRVKRA